MEFKVVKNQVAGVVEVQDTILNELAGIAKIHMSSTAKYHLMMARLKGRDVRFADHETYLLNLAKKAGLWESEDDLRRAEVLDLEWFHSITLFIGWRNRNFNGSYTKVSPKSGTSVRQEKAKEEKKQVVKAGVRKLTKAKLEKAVNGSKENQDAVMSWVIDNLETVIEKLASDEGTKRILIDALEANGIN